MTGDLHSLLAPYALDALDPHERARFEAHLDECPDCRAELAGFRATATRLAEAQSRTPPAGLRDRLVTAVASTPQERPQVSTTGRRGPVRHRATQLVAAAVLAAAVGGAGGYVVERERTQEQRQQTLAMTSVLAAPDAEITARTLDGGGTIRLVASESRDAAVVVADGLPDLADDKVYQVWVIKDAVPASHGTFTTSGAMVMEDLAGVAQVAVTIEPEGGSEQPTTDPIVGLPI